MNQDEKRRELLELLWANCAPGTEQNANIVTRLLIANGWKPEDYQTDRDGLLTALGLKTRTAAGIRLVTIPARETPSESVEPKGNTSEAVESVPAVEQPPQVEPAQISSEAVESVLEEETAQLETLDILAKAVERLLDEQKSAASNGVEEAQNPSKAVESTPSAPQEPPKPVEEARIPSKRVESARREFNAAAQAEVRALLQGEFAPGSRTPMAQVFHFLDVNNCAAKSFALDGEPLKGRRILEILGIPVEKDAFGSMVVCMPGGTQKASKGVEISDNQSESVENAPQMTQNPSNSGENAGNQPPKDCRNEVFFPIANRERLAEQLGVPSLNQHYWDEVNAAYDAAAAEGQVTWNEQKHCFNAVLSLTNTSGYPLLLGISRSDQKNGLPFYLSFVGTAPKAARLSPLQEFAWLGNYHSFLQQLAELAEPEMWSFQGRDDLGILNNYITYTFARLKQQGKVYIDPNERFAAFNTGLMSRIYGEDLLAYFVPNNLPGRQKWMFSAFCSTLDEARGDRTQQTAAITLAPVRSKLTLASYFTDVCFETRFDPNSELDYQFFHIIGDNIGRFPLDFLRKHCNDFPRSKALLAQIEAEPDIAKQRQLFKTLGAAVTDLDDADMSALFYDLRIQFEAAVNRTLELARRDYKVGVPCFFPTTGKLSMLLPIAFSARRNAKPCLALVAERLENGMYIGRTVLTMDMAYKDSRLLCRPSGEWLRPAEIQADALEVEE